MAKNLKPCTFIVKTGGEALSSVEATAKALEGKSFNYIENSAKIILDFVGSVADKNLNTNWGDWFLGENKNAKNRIALDIQSNLKLRNALMSNLYDLWKKETKSNMLFEDFLNTEITLYRGGEKGFKNEVDVDGFNTWELTKEGAKKFAKGEDIVEKKIPVKNLYGAIDFVGGEIEVLEKTKISDVFAKEIFEQQQWLDLISENLNSNEIKQLTDLTKQKKFNEALSLSKRFIAEAYHAAKKDGSNPELVKAVEDLLGTGKELRLSYDEMRQYLLDNPELWADIPTRRKGEIGKGQARIVGLPPATEEQLAGEKEVEALKRGEMITTTHPIRLLKGIYGKRNADGSIRSAHTGVNGVFSSIKEKIAERYMGDEGVVIFDIPAGVTVDTVEIYGTEETRGRDYGVSKLRPAETEAINNSDAQIVKLITFDSRGQENQYIVKDPELRKLAYKLEEGKGQARSISAFHGSPYAFEKFTTQKMGTGEGVQAFGWGLYFTDLKDIAENYAKVLGSGRFKTDYGDETIRDIMLSDRISEGAYDAILDVYASNPNIKNKTELLYELGNKYNKKDGLLKFIFGDKIDKKYYLEAYQYISTNVSKTFPATKNLYTVTLHKGKKPSEYSWLEWDKRVDKKKVQDLLSKLTEDQLKKFNRMFFDGLPIDATNVDLYKGLSKALGGDKQASLFLLENGIDGIKYPAESLARGTTSETARGFNYVVFDENAITIDERIQFRKAGFSGNVNNDTVLYEVGGEKLRESNYNVAEALKAVKAYLVSTGMTEKKAEERIDKSKLEQRMSRLALNYAASGQEAVSGIAKRLVPQEIIDSVNINRRTAKEMLDRGKGLVDNGTIDPVAMVNEIAFGAARVLSPDEVAAAVYYKNNLDNKAAELYREINKAKEKGNRELENKLKAQVKNVERALVDYEMFSVRTAYEQSLAFRLRQLLTDAAYSLVNMKTKYAAKFGYVPDDVAKKFEEYDRKWEELRKAQEEFEKLKEEWDNKDIAERLAEHYEAERTNPKVTKPKVIATLQSWGSKITKPISSIFSRKGSGQARKAKDTSNGEMVYRDAVGMVMDYVADKNDVSEKVVNEAIAKAMKYIKASTWYGTLTADEKVEAEKEFTSSIKDGVVEPFAVGKNGLKIPNDVIKYYVAEEGLKDIDEVSKAILRDYKAQLPEGITARDIRDAITQYGVRIMPSQEEIDKTIREMKRIGMKRSQLEDIKKGIRPLKSGLVRDEKTQIIRDMEREINQGLKELGIDDVNPEVYLKSALERIKTALGNQIKDLEKEIKTIEDKIAAGEKVEGFKKSVKKVEYDTAAQALKEQRDALKKVREDLLEKAGVNTQIKIDNAIKALEQSITEYERRLNEGDFSSFRTGEELPETPELKAAREKRDALRKEYNERKNALVTPEMKEMNKLRDLQDKLDDLLQKDAEGYYAEGIEVRPRTTPESAAVKDLRNQIAAMEQRLGIAKLPEAKELERLREQLAKILRGETTTGKGKRQGPDLPSIAILKQKIQNAKDSMGVTFRKKEDAALKAKLNAIQKIEREIARIERTGQRTPRAQKFNSAATEALNQVIKGKRKALEQILEQTGIADLERMEAAKERDRRYIEELERRLREKDFTKKRKPPIDFDAEGKRIQREKRKIKDLYDYEFAKKELEERNTARKVRDLIVAGYNVPKSLLSGLDMSAPLRQGLPFLIGQLLVPGVKNWRLSFEGQKKALDNLKFMFQSTYDVFSGIGDSKEFYDNWLTDLKESDDYNLMKAAGLYIAEESAKLKAGEELFANNILHRLPIWQAPLVVQGRTIVPGLGIATRSERAFNSFINYQRVQIFRDMAEVFKDAGMSEQQNLKDFKNLASAINLFTGRAGLGKAESAAGILNGLFFSIKLLVSRFQIFNPFWYASLYAESPQAAWFALRTTAKFTFAMMELLGLAYLYYGSDDDDDTKVELNPFSSGFGSIQISKDTKIDITGGVSKAIGFVSKLLGGEFVSATTGETKEMKPEDKALLLLNFIVGKANPTLRLPANYWLSQENKEGDRLTQFGELYSLQEDLLDLITPLIIQDTVKLAEKEGIAKTAALILASFFGVSVSTKPERYKTAKDISREKIAGETRETRQEERKADVQLKEGEPKLFEELIEKDAEEQYLKDYPEIEKDENMPDDVKENQKKNLFGIIKYDMAKDKFFSMTSDKIGAEYFPAKKPYKSDELVEAFFHLMTGTAYPPISPYTPEGQVDKIERLRNGKLERVNKLDDKTKATIIELYRKQAEERRATAATFNKMGLTINGNKVDWNEEFQINADGIPDWYTMYEEYDNQKIKLK
jgi:hypothetical protein